MMRQSWFLLSIYCWLTKNSRGRIFDWSSSVSRVSLNPPVVVGPLGSKETEYKHSMRYKRNSNIAMIHTDEVLVQILDIHLLLFAPNFILPMVFLVVFHAQS